MSTSTLSEDALNLLKLRRDGHRVEVTDDTREAYRELARAGLMEALTSFARGREGAYRLTEAGVNSSPSPLLPSPGRSAAPPRRSACS